MFELINFEINRCNVLILIHSYKYYFDHRNVDVTGETYLFSEWIPMQSVQMRGSNISFGVVDGNPISVLGQEGEMDDGDDFSSVTCCCDKSASSTGSFGLFSGDHYFTNRYRYCYIYFKILNLSYKHIVVAVFALLSTSFLNVFC